MSTSFIFQQQQHHVESGKSIVLLCCIENNMEMNKRETRTLAILSIPTTKAAPNSPMLEIVHFYLIHLLDIFYSFITKSIFKCFVLPITGYIFLLRKTAF